MSLRGPRTSYSPLRWFILSDSVLESYTICGPKCPHFKMFQMQVTCPLVHHYFIFRLNKVEMCFNEIRICVCLWETRGTKNTGLFKNKKCILQVLLNLWRRDIYRLKGELLKLFSHLTSTQCEPRVTWQMSNR
jgi:hypothetical protein